jgi:hypothetical protein
MKLESLKAGLKNVVVVMLIVNHDLGWFPSSEFMYTVVEGGVLCHFTNVPKPF